MIQTELLAIAIQIKQSTMLVGDPGVGKTDIIEGLTKEIAKRLHGGVEHFPFVMQSLNQIMPEELAGASIPNHTTKTMDSYAMGTIKELILARKGVYLGDEYGSCEGPVRAAMLNVVQNHIFGDTRLPDIAVVMTMNPPDQAVNGKEMSLPESNRPFFLNWNLSNDAWFDWMRGGKGANAVWREVPPDWKLTTLPRIRALIVSYLSKNPKAIHEIPKAEGFSKPWPSNRSWTNASNMLAAVIACGYDFHSDQAAYAVAGCIGNGHSEAFLHWAKEKNLPDPEDLLRDPMKGAKTLKGMMAKKIDAIISLEGLATAAIVREHPDFKKRYFNAMELLRELASFQDVVAPALKIMIQTEAFDGQVAMIPTELESVVAHFQEIGTSKFSAKKR
jgi:hypothetical protein